ncbi:MAG: alpha/beta hydrolase fold domain-containing protein [Sphingobacterium sp.]
MKKEFLLSILSLLCFLFAQSQTAHPDSSNVHKDLIYKITSKDSLKLDLFLPDSRFGNNFPLLIIVHGGAWIAGDKELESIYYMRRMKERLLESGIAVASIQYRLVDEQTHFPAPIEDAKDAVRWLFKHAKDYRVDTNNIGVWGGSAGGHLAMLMAYTDYEEFPGDDSLRDQSYQLNYVIDNFGPTDLNSLFRLEMQRVGVLFFKLFINKLYLARERLTYFLTGLNLKEDLEPLKETNLRYSPLQYINEHAPPTLIFHGTRDGIVPYTQSQTLKKHLDNHSVDNELITVINGDHGFNNISEDRINTLVEQTLNFIFLQTRR